MNGSSENIKNNLVLLLAASIWGFAFVAQRIGMVYVGPFFYTGIRFALGALTVLPFLIISRFRIEKIKPPDKRTVLLGSVASGLALCLAANLQQIGIVSTAAGKAGFITGLYVVLVPVFGIFFGHHTKLFTWVGCALAVCGLYLLSIKKGFIIQKGDLFVMASAFFWAIHINIIGVFSSKVGPVRLAFFQFTVCSVLSLAVAFLFETITLSGIYQAALPILYGGVMSAGIAFTLQVVSQEKANPAHAAIIMSLETVFAAIGGFFVLGEHLSARDLAGCILMLSGMIVSQLFTSSEKREPV